MQTNARALVTLLVVLQIACGSGEAAPEPTASENTSSSSNPDPDPNANHGSPNAPTSPTLAALLAAPPAALTRVAENPLVDPRTTPSPLSGTPQMLGILDPCAVWDEEDALWRVYWSASDVEIDESGGDDGGMFSATSPDGVSFTMIPKRVLPRVGTFDSATVETCDVVIVGEGEQRVFYMFYSGSETAPEDSEYGGKYKIALATSTDGETFTPISAQESPLGLEGVLFGNPEVTGAPDVFGNFITDPVVNYVDGVFHMWTLCIDQVPEPFGGVCYHTSTDALAWQHHGVVSGLQRAFPIQPTVFYNPATDEFEMYVVMDSPEEEAQIHDPAENLTLRVMGFFHAVSSDGENWIEVDPSERQFEQDLSRPWEDLGLATGADAEIKDGVVYVFYPSFTSQGGFLFDSLANWPLNLAVRAAARE